MGLCGLILVKLGLYGVIWSYMELYGFVWGYIAKVAKPLDFPSTEGFPKVMGVPPNHPELDQFSAHRVFSNTTGLHVRLEGIDGCLLRAFIRGGWQKIHKADTLPP